MYGTCNKCWHQFETQHDFGEHECVREAAKLSRLELATQLFKSGKMSEKTYRQVQKEER